MAETAFTLYKGFLIAEYSETDVRAYRSHHFYADNTTSYEALNQADLSGMIDGAEDQGDFSAPEYNELMTQLGRSGISSVEPVEPKYPSKIMETMRQRLLLEPEDTSRDQEINTMSSNEVFDNVLDWEGLINHGSLVRGWVKDIYKVDLGSS